MIVILKTGTSGGIIILHYTPISRRVQSTYIVIISINYIRRATEIRFEIWQTKTITNLYTRQYSH